MDVKKRDSRIGNYVLGIRYDFALCKYKIIIALSGWESNADYIDGTSFARDLNYKVDFDSEEEADFYVGIIEEKIADWHDLKERIRRKNYESIF